MWNCPRCDQSIDESFRSCWACGTDHDGTVDPQFQHADLYEPPLPDDSGQFALLHVIALVTACSLIFTLLGSPSRLTLVLGFGGAAWLAAHVTGWLLIGSVHRWQRRYRKRQGR